MEEATRQTIDEDGWLHTGDLAVMDENGYFKISGRIRDMIIRGGENIYPREIEELIYTHPAVSDAGDRIPSKNLGRNYGLYNLKEKDSVTEEELAVCTENMARHKVPSHISFVEEFPDSKRKGSKV